MRHSTMRISITAIVVVISIIAATIIVYASSSGVVGTTRKGSGGGCSCHGTASGLVTVTIAGPETLNINQTASYTATITGGPAIKGGINIAASNGGTLTAGTGLKKVGVELTHSTPKVASGGSTSFTFTYKAPATIGTQTLYAVGNSVNGNNGTSGDQWNHASNKSILIIQPTAVGDNPSTIPSHVTLYQNFPNPFNPSTTIRYELHKTSHVTIAIFDILGKEISTIADGIQTAGYKTQEWNPGNLAGGIYFYRLTAGDFSETKKMILAR